MCVYSSPERKANVRLLLQDLDDTCARIVGHNGWLLIIEGIEGFEGNATWATSPEEPCMIKHADCAVIVPRGRPAHGGLED